MSIRMRVFRLGVIALLLVLTVPAGAQDTPPPDPFDLARRLLGYDGEIAIPPPARAYETGDKDSFWVSKAGQDAPAQVTATLAAQTANIYLWVEDGIAYERDGLAEMVSDVGTMLDIIRIEANHPQIQIVPEAPQDAARLSTLRLPDVDNDPHLYVLYTRDLADGRPTLYNPANSFPAAYLRDGYSNQHEMIFINTSLFPTTPLHSTTYFNLMARQFYAMLAEYNNPWQASWLTEAASWYMLLTALGADLRTNDVRAFLDEPGTSLTRMEGLTSSSSEFGAQQLFLRYVLQRFGPDVLRDMTNGSGVGLNALDDALQTHHITDLVSGSPLSADAVFADFVMANILNSALGDGRYLHTHTAAQNQRAVTDNGQDQFNLDVLDQVINQYGTRYIVWTASQPTDFSLIFEGQERLPRLPMPFTEAVNHFYWSGGDRTPNGTMTRAFDLSSVSTATLTFDVWHALAFDSHYAYVEVSTDAGVTWDVLPFADTSPANPYGLNYGAGFTGISNSEKPRPFPSLGVVLGTDGVTIQQVAPGGAVSQTDIQPGDVIAGYDGQPWEGQPNIIQFLSNYQPGDTVNLYIQRGEDFRDVPVQLGERILVPGALWMPQQVDLSPYTGQIILLRFETLRHLRADDSGVAVDNIAIPEIGFQDDAEGSIPGWTLSGWAQTDNQARGRYIVQAAVLGDQGARVQPLIGGDDEIVSGAWDFSLETGDVLILAISGASDETTVPAIYNLRLRQPDEQPS